MLGRSLIVAALITGSIVPASARASSVDQIVTSFYSPRLAEQEAQAVSDGDFPREHKQAWAPLTSAGDVIAVGYSDGVFADVRVLRIADGRGSLLWEVSELLDGDAPQIQTTDLNGDGHLDFIVTFATGQGRYSVSSIFLFEGQSVTPVSLGANYYPDSIDINGDGVMELVDGDSDLNGNHWMALYRLTPDGYKKAEPVLYDGVNGRGEKAQPSPKTEHFLSTARSATLLVLNGVGEFPRSAAVEVYLNGERVVSRNQFNETVARVEVPVTLLTNDTPNKITSTVFGKPNAGIELLVYVAKAEANTNAP